VLSRPEFELDVSAVFDRYIDSQQKQWAHDRSQSVGASEIFSCMRKNWFSKIGSKKGYEKDPEHNERWGAMQRGNLIEDYHVAPAFANCLPEPLEALYIGQENQTTLVDGRSSATPDGLITGIPPGKVRIKARGREDIIIKVGAEGCIGLEIKSIDPRANLHEARTKHHGQSQVGMGLIRQQTEYKPNYWMIMYVDASFLDDMKIFMVEYDDDIFRSAQRRAKLIFDAKNPTDLPAEGKYTHDCDHCPFTEACREAVFSKYKQMEIDGDDEVDDAAALAMAPLVEEFLHAREELDEADFKVRELKERLKSQLEQLNKRKVVGENWKATWSTRKGAKRIDKKLMREDGIDLDKYEVEGKPFDTLLVTIQD